MISNNVIIHFFSDLKEFSIGDIKVTFNKHKEQLEGLFNKLKYERNAKALRADDMIFSNVIDVLLTGDQQRAMINTLGKKFADSSDFNEVSALFSLNQFVLFTWNYYIYQF